MTGSKIQGFRSSGSQLRDRIYELLDNRGYPCGSKNILLRAYMAIALEHHEAIHFLLELNFCGSAFALARPLFETMFRALWINGCATQSQIEEVATRDNARFPLLEEMVAAIDHSYSTDGFFTLIKRTSWTAMCSYTHSGLLQITRHFTGENVKPNYDHGEMFEVLNATNIAMILLSRMFFMSVGWQCEATEIKNMMAQCVMPTRSPLD